VCFPGYFPEFPLVADTGWGGGAAPDPTYPTLGASNGARHLFTPGGGLFLGNAVDSEIDGQPSPDADGDDTARVDDEDGVVFPLSPGIPLIEPGRLINVDVDATEPGNLNAWIDFNRDGDWADAGEQIFTDTPLVAGVNHLSFTPPAAAPAIKLGDTYGRFRVSTAPGLSFDGIASDGEVEDYKIIIGVLVGLNVDVHFDYHEKDANDFHFALLQFLDLRWS
jgi:hypothetical protein